jgi:ubiquinone/menaquinone biosynthesis C-methylase UbiE
VATRTYTLIAGQYFLAIEGLALVRALFTDPEAALPFVDEIREISTGFDEFPHSLAIPLVEHDVDEGYSLWAPIYDGPNPAIQAEEPIVHELLAELPPGAALDAACGTGRHLAHLSSLGHDVIGVDANHAMLDVARAKVPGADVRQGRLEALPVDDSSVDLITCALALTHVPDLEPVMKEFARVLRPGGHAVLSDIHPFSTVLGASIAGFAGKDVTKGIPYVVNRFHSIGDYITAFNAAGLSIEACIEPPFTDLQITTMPSFGVYPRASRQAFEGLPSLLIWHLNL